MDHPRFLRSAASDGVAPDVARWFLFVQDRLVLVNDLRPFSWTAR